MADRLWLATDSDGETYAYTSRPRINNYGTFTGTRYDHRGADAIPPGECWEYVRTDCVDTESGALASAKAEIERLKAELAEALRVPDCVRELLACADNQNTPWSDVEPHVEAIRHYYDPPTPINETLAEAKDGIAKLASELAEAKRMPECVRELVACIDIGGGSWSDLEKHTAAVRQHYAPPVKLSVGEWRLSNGSQCRVWTDGKQFNAFWGGNRAHLHEDGACIGSETLCLVERIGD